MLLAPLKRLRSESVFRQRMEASLLEKQKEADARHTVAAVEARLREDNSAADAAMRRAERAAEVER